MIKTHTKSIINLLDIISWTICSISSQFHHKQYVVPKFNDKSEEALFVFLTDQRSKEEICKELIKQIVAL